MVKCGSLAKVLSNRKTTDDIACHNSTFWCLIQRVNRPICRSGHGVHGLLTSYHSAIRNREGERQAAELSRPEGEFGLGRAAAFPLCVAVRALSGQSPPCEQGLDGPVTSRQRGS